MRNYKFSISDGSETVWFTRDGTESGSPCRSTPEGIAELYEALSGNTSPAAGGDPFTEHPLDSGGNRPFVLRFPGYPRPRFAELQTFKAGTTSATELTLTIDAGDDIGQKTVTFIWHYNPVPVTWGRFSTINVKDLQIRGITTPAA